MQSYNTTDQILHILCQTIAKAGRSFVLKKADDSHTNLYFDAMRDRIVSRWIEAPNQRVLLLLNLTNQRFEIIDDRQKKLASIDTVSNSIQQIEQNVANAFADLKLDVKGFTDPLHFEIPQYKMLNEPIPTIDKQDLEAWKAIRALANASCVRFLGSTQTQEEVRIWPHHFDTGIYTETNSKLGIGFGLAMKDNMIGAPYFYMSGYALHGKIEYIGMPESEHLKWIVSNDWNGAVIPFDQLTDATLEEQNALLNFNMIKAYNWFVNQ